MRAKFEFTDIPAGFPANSIVIKNLLNPAEPSVIADAAAVVQTLLRIAAMCNEPINVNEPGLFCLNHNGTVLQLEHDGTEFTRIKKAAAPNGRN